MTSGAWIVYILQCADGTLYTGITNDIEHRIAKHVAGKGAKYTRGRGPYKLLFSETCSTKSRALRRETEIKALTKAEKADLCATWQEKRLGKS
jgi:putative endonuclease